MTNLAEDLEIWFKERPLWLQDAARRLLDKGELDETDYSDLLKICSKEAGVEFKSEEFVDGQCIPVGAFAPNEHTHKVELCSISNVIGINALNPRNPLEIKDGLTVIYGQNGSGKSGYTRLLKQVCGAKKAGDLHHNVYEAKAVSQSCKIKYKYDGNDCELNWDTSQGINEQLSTIELYDSECGSVYVVDENQLAYEPALLRLFTKLTTASDNLSSRLDSLSKESPSTKPLLPANYTTTKSGQWYTSINFKTSDSEINQECAWSDYNQKSLDALNVRLKSPDPKANAIAIRKTKLQVDKLVADFCNWQPKLSDEACSAYLASKKDCSVKQLAASEYAKSIFQNSPLTGIGEEAWNLLWEQARAYSQNVAYPQLEFPNVENEAVCVLCQQPFDNETKKRFSDFEGFVKGELELAAKKAKKVLDEIEKSLTKTPEEELINSFIVAAGLDDAMSQKVRTLREEIAQKSKELLDTEIDKEYTAKLDFTVTDELIALSESKEETAKQLDKDAEKDQRDAIQKEALELEAKKWISEQKQEILTEVCLLNKKAKITHAKKSVNTSALTIKKSSLAELLVTAEYICRFEKEIEKLGAGRIKVFLEKTRSAKGEVYFQIKLKNNLLPLSVDKVLSEGEFRIISLAAFLADVEGHVDKSTFIFDDPISSLDQDYEEKVVKRLVELSTTRQVIVFTHRLSLMALLDASNTIGLSKEPWGTGEPSSLLPIHTQNTKKAINTLIDKIPEGRKKFNDEGTEPYSWWVKGVCSHTRITIEKVIEFDLLADVVQRFRRPITTQGKLHKVAKVTLEDCKYIDKLMTKYSRYEHSQPSEAPVQSPEPSELEADLTKLKKGLKNLLGVN